GAPAARGVAAGALPQAGRQVTGLAESLRGPQRDVPPCRVRAEQLGEYPVGFIGVVHEQEQVAKAEQGVRAGPGGAQGTGPAVYVADHVNPHAHRLRAARPGAAADSPAPRRARNAGAGAPHAARDGAIPARGARAGWPVRTSLAACESTTPLPPSTYRRQPG